MLGGGVTLVLIAASLAATSLVGGRGPASVAPAYAVTIFPAPTATPTLVPSPSLAAPATVVIPTETPQAVNAAVAPTEVPVAEPVVIPSATQELIMLVPQAVAPAAAVAEPRLVEAPAATPIPVPVAGACPAASSASYGLIGADGVYKGNRLTDMNADLRLSVIGYVEAAEPLTLMDYNGATDPGAPKLSGVFEPNRGAAFTRAYRRFDWNWDEYAPPPHGSRMGVNAEWPVTVVDLAATPGEGVHIPERGADIGGYTAMVLFASEEELSLAYHRQDSVSDGYVVHMLGFCVDPNLVALYRAQTPGGKRATGSLPALRNNERVGVAKTGAVTIAVRDRGAFLDPRSRKDWW